VIATCKLENQYDALSHQKTESLNGARAFNLQMGHWTTWLSPCLSIQNIGLEKGSASNDMPFYYLLRLRHIWNYEIIPNTLPIILFLNALLSPWLDMICLCKTNSFLRTEPTMKIIFQNLVC